MAASTIQNSEVLHMDMIGSDKDMMINISPSEAGMICQSLRSFMYQHDIDSDTRYQYSILLGNFCDAVKDHFQSLYQDDMYVTWLEEFDLITPF